MLPVLAQFSVAGAEIAVPAYSTCLLIAAITACWLFVRAAVDAGAPRRRTILLAIGAAAGGLVGARLLDASLNPALYAHDPDLLTTTNARGFALYGGLVAAGTVALGAAPLLRVQRGRLADAAVPAVAAGIAIARVGCFLNGCCGGVATSVPWAVRFPIGSSSWSSQLLGGSTSAIFGHVDAVHPTQLYELVAVLACAGVSRVAAARLGLAPGGRALLFAATFLAFRVVNQTLRAPTPGGALGSSGIMLTYAVVAVAAGLLLARLVRRSSPGRSVASA